MKLQPVRSDVIIHPIDHAPMSSGGIIHTAEAQRKRKINQGVVVAIGPLVPDDIGITTADHVLFNAYSGDKIVLASGGEFIVIPYHHILAKLSGSDVVLVDTVTMERLVNERKHELLQKYSDDIAGTKMVREVCEALMDRVASISLSEGFEF